MYTNVQALQQLDGYELYMERYAETRKKIDWLNSEKKNWEMCKNI